MTPWAPQARKPRTYIPPPQPRSMTSFPTGAISLLHHVSQDVSASLSEYARDVLGELNSTLHFHTPPSLNPMILKDRGKTPLQFNTVVRIKLADPTPRVPGAPSNLPSSIPYRWYPSERRVVKSDQHLSIYLVIGKGIVCARYVTVCFNEVVLPHILVP